MRGDEFDYVLPSERIALRPLRPRGSSRLLVIGSGDGEELVDSAFSVLPDLLRDGDVLVFNDCRVLPTRLSGRRVRSDGSTGARIEATLLSEEDSSVDVSRWRALMRPGRRVVEGDAIEFSASDGSAIERCEVTRKGDGGEFELVFGVPRSRFCDEFLSRFGSMPLPPYIASRRAPDAQDAEDYQTIYARRGRAIAAPTAGLHFTEATLSALEARGVERRSVTLEVGEGTFRSSPSSERGEIDESVAEALNRAVDEGRRIIAVGTTSLRLLESATDESGRIHPFRGTTSLFVAPGYSFRAVRGLLTNFHLPRSTLFMLACAFGGVERMRRAYQHAIEANYRFYSYGDACLIFPPR